MGVADIQQAALVFARKSEALLSNSVMAPAHRLRAERDATVRQLELAQRELLSVEERANDVIAAQAQVTATQDRLQRQIADQVRRCRASEVEMAELEVVAADANPEDVTKLQALVSLNEQMGVQRSEFKRQCAQQLEAMQRELTQLNEEQSVHADDEHQNLLEIERLHSVENGKANQMRRLVGQKGREIAALHRQVDDIPTSAELMQYERRFRELFQQVAGKLQETKKFYSLFNTLEEKKGYLSKEVSLLNSIHENFTKATSNNKDKIVESVETLLKSVQQMLHKVEARLSDAKTSHDAAQQRYDKLVEKQRKYYQLVKDYQLECQRNETLST